MNVVCHSETECSFISKKLRVFNARLAFLTKLNETEQVLFTDETE